MDKLSLIMKPITTELADYKSVFDATLQSDNALLGDVLQFVGLRNGKMMRPILMLLVAKNLGVINEYVLHAAASLELLHTASLVHDDVVDESGERRGQKSVNSKFGNKVAVLSGDYLLSNALYHAAKTRNVEVISLISSLGQTLAKGELLQLSNIENSELSEEVYYEVISQKTASLFATCAEIGAVLVGATSEEVAKAHQFGHILGLCFQIKDDIFDYALSAEIGKPTGNDMREGKLTLPALYALNNSHDVKAHELALKVKNGTISSDEIAQLVEFVKQNGGIDYAEQKMNELRNEACQILDDIGVGDTKQSLRYYLAYVLDREK